MSIASRIQAMEQHLTDDYSVLEVAGADLTNVDKNIVNLKLTWQERLLYFINNGTDVVWNNWEKVEGTGETLTLNSTEEAPMKINLKGNTSQEGTPTPETPQDVHVVSGDNSIKVEGKNILHLSNTTITNGGITGTITNDNILTYSGTANRAYADITSATTGVTLQAGTYIFSIDQPQNVRVVLYGIGGNNIITAGNTQITINVSEERQFNYRIGLTGLASGTAYSGTIKLQLEKSSSKTEYEPYQSASYPINLGNIELCKIGDYQDSIVKDNGKWYLNKQIGKVVLDGTETGWSYPSANRFNLDNYVTGYLKETYKITYLSDQYVPKYQTTANAEFNTATANLDYAFNFGSGASNNIRFKDTRFTSVNEFKAELALHNLTIYYVLATPTYTEITDSTLLSQLEALNGAKSYTIQTNISQENNDKPFILDVTALKQLT